MNQHCLLPVPFSLCSDATTRTLYRQSGQEPALGPTEHSILRSTVASQMTKLLIDQTDVKAIVTLGPAGWTEPLADKPDTLSATPGPAWTRMMRE